MANQSFKKGQILEYYFPKRAVKKTKDSKVIRDSHRVVVLHSRQTPYSTVLIAPITKSVGLSDKNSIPINYVRLSKNSYPAVLTEDCYINLDMCIVVDAEEITKLERYCKTFTANLNDVDMNELDYKLILTYELSGYIRKSLEEQVSREIKAVIELIDSDFKQKLVTVLDKIEDTKIKEEVLYIVNELVNEMSSSYFKKIVT